jgi:hypothetical protein
VCSVPPTKPSTQTTPPPQLSTSSQTRIRVQPGTAECLAPYCDAGVHSVPPTKPSTPKQPATQALHVITNPHPRSAWHRCECLAPYCDAGKAKSVLTRHVEGSVARGGWCGPSRRATAQAQAGHPSPLCANYVFSAKEEIRWQVVAITESLQGSSTITSLSTGSPRCSLAGNSNQQWDVR